MRSAVSAFLAVLIVSTSCLAAEIEREGQESYDDVPVLGVVVEQVAQDRLDCVPRREALRDKIWLQITEPRINFRYLTCCVGVSRRRCRANSYIDRKISCEISAGPISLEKAMLPF